jgi:repressor LexA
VIILLIGEFIKKARKEKGVTQLELYKMTGLSQGYIADIENGRIKNPTDKTLDKIGSVLGFTKADILKLQLSTIGDKTSDSNVDISEMINFNTNDVIQIPIVGTVRAGQPILAVDNIQGYFPVSKNIVKADREYFYLIVKGDSMNLEFYEGSLLLIEKTSYIENGEIGVILIDGLEATVKKVVKNDDMITLIPLSSNPEYTPIMYDIIKDEIQIIGKVKMAIKTY